MGAKSGAKGGVLRAYPTSMMAVLLDRVGMETVTRTASTPLLKDMGASTARLGAGVGAGPHAARVNCF